MQFRLKGMREQLTFFGSALKFVARTPDNDDYKLLLTKHNILTENNNK